MSIHTGDPQTRHMGHKEDRDMLTETDKKTDKLIATGT